jgi:wyosine [tRNA(Phe)-imidazoG37] synthetase (radical SAM superfamily)
MQVDRAQFYDPEEIFRNAKKKVENAQNKGESIDYLTFVPDGEPTLDANLGKEIDLLKSLGLKIAVITNGSLIGYRDVRADLAKADWVSFKIDSTSGKIWRRINRPQKTLKMSAILEGMLEFAKRYSGKLVTETMLVENINDSDNSLRKMADFLNHLQPVKAYLSVPTRPPAEKWVRLPDATVINQAFQILDEMPFQVEYLIGYEGNAFAFTGDVQNDLLSITAVHPMREQAVSALLKKAGKDWAIVRKLIASNVITETTYGGKKFYIRNFPKKNIE